MADDEKLELAPNEVALVRCAGFIDNDGDPMAVVIIGGVCYARLCESLEDVFETTRTTMENLVRFQKSSTVRLVKHGSDGEIKRNPNEN